MEGSDVQMIQRRGEARDGWNENKCGWMVMLVGGGASSGLFEFSIPGLGFFYLVLISLFNLISTLSPQLCFGGLPNTSNTFLKCGFYLFKKTKLSTTIIKY